MEWKVEVLLAAWSARGGEAVVAAAGGSLPRLPLTECPECVAAEILRRAAGVEARFGGSGWVDLSFSHVEVDEPALLLRLVYACVLPEPLPLSGLEWVGLLGIDESGRECVARAGRSLTGAA